LGGLACATAMIACSGGSDGSGAGSGASADVAHATIGAQGGEIVGQAGSALDGVHLVIPPGALSADTDISIRRAGATTPLPTTAVECGPEFSIEPAGLKLAVPASLTVPFDETTVTDNDRFDDQVKVWVMNGSKWGQQLQTDSESGKVTVDLDTLTVASAGVNPPDPVDVVHIDFHPNPKFTQCLAEYVGDASQAPTVSADVVRGDLNDGLFLRGRNIKPGLAFDMFTVENSSLNADGTPNPNFKNFGFAWYQSDLEANDHGNMRAQIRTILLDQIFGFDPAANLPPTNTFEVGFWFNDPNDAAPCGFDVTQPTPFNGDHKAGPLAMITVPDASTGLGPLCTKPDTSVTPARCDP
jgi:hypothetical protein